MIIFLSYSKAREFIKLDQPLTSNSNVGEFGHKDSEIVHFKIHYMSKVFCSSLLLATIVLPFCLPPIINSLLPHLIGIIKSIAISLVWRGLYTERLEIILGAGDSINRDS